MLVWVASGCPGPLLEPASPKAAAVYASARCADSALVGTLSPLGGPTHETIYLCGRSVEGEGVREETPHSTDDIMLSSRAGKIKIYRYVCLCLQMYMDVYRRL